MSRRTLWSGLVLALWGSVGAGDAVARTTLSLDTVTVDGQEVRSLSCSLESGGLLASVLVVGALAKQKTALDACAPKGAAFRVDWTWAGGATTLGAVTGGPPDKVDCITRALQPLPAPASGTCSAVVLVGETTAASAAADALLRQATPTPTPAP